ncbi:MAG: type II toxin-antitoxin system PemK/MazF family toxin [Gemella sp.]|nr:type II toxin-antitoxin system PemK/MazF family toxin [Gemella sp.]
MDIGGVYLVDFPRKGGNEFYGKHYAVVISKIDKGDGTLLVAPITGKKKGKKYRGGIAIDNYKYQSNPTYDSAFIYVRKIQEIDKRKINYDRKKQVDENGNILLDAKGNELFKKEYVKIYQLDDNDFNLLRDKCKGVIKFNW